MKCSGWWERRAPGQSPVCPLLPSHPPEAGQNCPQNLPGPETAAKGGDVPCAEEACASSHIAGVSLPPSWGCLQQTKLFFPKKNPPQRLSHPCRGRCDSPPSKAAEVFHTELQALLYQDERHERLQSIYIYIVKYIFIFDQCPWSLTRRDYQPV